MDLVSKFTQDLYSCPMAYNYLTKVRHYDDAIIEKFKLGYCNSNIKELAPNSDVCWLSNRIVIPVRDSYGSVIGYAGRAISEKVKPKYINTSYVKSNYLFNLDKAKKSINALNCAIIVEGHFDCISLSNYYNNVVATCGSVFTERQAVLLLRYCNRVLILGDTDDAGKKATIKTSSILNKYYFKVATVSPYPCKDIDECLQNIVYKEQVLDAIANKLDFGSIYEYNFKL